MRTTVARLLLATALLPAGPAGAQECPDPRRDLCPPGLVCGVPATEQCSCLSCVTRSCELVPKNCDDDDPCTIDTCDDLTGCHHRPLCDDDDPCTNRRCIRVPVVPEVVLCSDPEPIPCDDGRFCNGTEACRVDGAGLAECAAGTARDCDDADACTGDACSEETKSCTHRALPCDDGDACTNDACDPIQGCTHTAVAGCCLTDAGCASGDPCAVPACDPGHRCTVRPVSGFDVLGCVCRRPAPAECATASLPRRLPRKQAKACAFVIQAAATTGTDHDRAVGKATRIFGALGRAVARPKMRKRLGACAEALGGVYRDAIDRAAQVTPGG
jgi:hypothetical protein